MCCARSSAIGVADLLRLLEGREGYEACDGSEEFDGARLIALSMLSGLGGHGLRGRVFIALDDAPRQLPPLAHPPSPASVFIGHTGTKV